MPAPPAPAPVEISAALRARLAGLADALVPAAGGMPAASEVGVAGVLLDRVLGVRPDLAAPLRAVLERAGDDPVVTLDELARDDRPGLRALRWVAGGGYYLSDDVRARLDYPGTVATPVRALAFPEYLEEGLLDHLVAPDD